MSKASQIGSDIMRHLQSGVSYVIPLICASAAAQAIGSMLGGDATAESKTLIDVIALIGDCGMGFICPMIAAYIAYSVADRPGLAPAFVCGLVAQEMGTGFLGGMVAGLFVGYIVYALKLIPVPEQLTVVKAFILIPMIAAIGCSLVYYYVIGQPIAAATTALAAWLDGMSGANAAILAAILGAMMAFDMGGPVNKVALAFGMNAYTTGDAVSLTAVFMAISIPPTIMWVATLLDRKHVLYDEEERANANTAVILGIFGITEGTIPFAVADPLRVIPSICVGTALSCAITCGLGSTVSTMFVTWFGIFMASNPIIYTAALVIGVLVGAIMVNALKSIGKKDAPAEGEEA